MAAVNSPRDQARPKSPFYSRTYGGYTAAQVEFITTVVGKLRGKTILDPMAGQAFEISTWSSLGAKVYLGDLDPALLILAALRSESIIRQREVFADDLVKKLDSINRRRSKCKSLRYVDEWIAPSIGNDLAALADRIGIGLFSDPYKFSPDFWVDNDQVLFEVGMALLAARELACYRTTDNHTWLRAGGRMRERRIRGPIKRAIAHWLEHARGVEASWDVSASGHGILRTARMDAAAGEFADTPKPTVIVTSPPYANRLEYTKMWGPETEVLAAMCGRTTQCIRRKQIGTTLVKDQAVRTLGMDDLPRKTIVALKGIRDDAAKYSSNYYYPFFQMYAQSLAACVRNMAEKLRRRGVMVLIVRDTVRKDQLFSTSDLVRDILGSEFGFEELECTRKIVKGHVGQLRKASTNGVYGTAQQEWWLSFRKV